MGGNEDRLTVSTTHLNIELRTWLYSLRMAEAHLQDSLTLTFEQHQFIYHLVRDLLGACEDAKAWIDASEARLLATPSQAGLGEDRR